MKKFFFIIGFVAFLTMQTFADEGTTVWSRIWGSTDRDYGYGVSVDNNGNVYVAGNTEGSFDGQNNNGGLDLCLTKYNNNGSNLWTRIWGSSKDDQAIGVNVDSAGNVYVGGHTSGSFDGQSNPSEPSGMRSLCLTKLNSSGTKQWTRIWGSSSYDFGGGISIDNAGNIYVAGYTSGTFDGQSNPGDNSLCLTKYNSSGTKQWTRIWGSSASDSGQSVSVDTNGNVYIAGYTFGSFDGQSNPGDRSLCLTKYNSNGSNLWTRIWGSSDSDYGKGVSVDTNGNIYVAGNTQGSFDGQSNPGDRSLCLTKYNISGSSLWTRIWGSSSYDDGRGVSIDNVGNIYVVGYTGGSFDGQSNPGNSSLCLTKYNSNGSNLWTRIWGSIDYDIGLGVRNDHAGNVYICGYTDNSFDGQSNPGKNSLCLTKKIGSFYINITNENAVSFGINKINIAGIQSAIVGKMCVSNSANNEKYFFNAEKNWITPSVSLEIGANIITVSGTNEVSDLALDTISIVRGFTNEVYLDCPDYGWRTNALTLDFNVWFGSDILPDQRFLSTNSGASWFYYTNSLTFPDEGTYFWTAKGLDGSYNSHYAAQTNKLIITTNMPDVYLIEPSNGTIITNEFAIDLIADYGSSSFARQLSTNSGISWFDYEPGNPVCFPSTGVWHWTARGQNAAGWSYAPRIWSLEIKTDFSGDYAVFLLKPNNGAIYTNEAIEFSIASFGDFNFHGLSTNNSAFSSIDFPATISMPTGSNIWTASGTYLIPSTTHIYAPSTNNFEIFNKESNLEVRLMAPKNSDVRYSHYVNFDLFLYKTFSPEMSTNNGASFFEYDPPVYFSQTGTYYWTVRAKDISNNWIYANCTNLLHLTEKPDRISPIANYVLINSGAAYTSNENIELTLSATDDNLSDMMISEVAKFSGAFWQEYSTSTNWHFDGGDGTKNIYAKFKDIAGNESGVVMTNIILDTQLPIVGTIAFSSNPAKAGAITTAVTFIDSPAGMNTAILPTVDYITANNRTGIIAQLDYIGNNWRGLGTILSGDDGVAYVNVMNGADKAGNIMLAVLNATNFLIDTTAPTNLFVQINGGATYSASHNVTLSINAEDVLGIEMLIGNDAGFSGGSWESYVATKAWVLANGDGIRTVYIKFRDAVGNESSTISDNIEVDTTPPSNPSVLINNGMEYTNSQNVSLTLSATDINLTEMRIAENPSFAGASWEAFAGNKSRNLSNGDGVKVIYVQFRDVVGNTSDIASANIILDKTKPIVDNVLFSVDPIGVGVVTVDVAFADSPAGMNISISPTVDFVTANGRTSIITQLDYIGNSWQGHGAILSGDDGIATLQISDAKDKAENVMIRNNNAGTFTIDTIPPTNYLMLINNGAIFATNVNVTITNYTVGADFIDISISQNFYNAQTTNYVDCFQTFLSNDDGTNYLYARYRDLAGNSTITNDSIILDTTPPTNASVVINGGDVDTENTNVVLTLSAVDPYLNEMRIANDAEFTGANWTNFAQSVNWILLEGIEEEKTVYVQFKDEVGWGSDTAEDSIMLVPEPFYLLFIIYNLLMIMRKK